MNKRLTNKQMEEYGYDLYDFGGECGTCNKIMKKGALFFRKPSHEYYDYEYICRKCARQKEYEYENAYELFINEISDCL